MHHKASPRGEELEAGKSLESTDGAEASMLTQDWDGDDSRKGRVEPRQELLRRQAPTRSCGKKGEVSMNVRPTGRGHH